jgi:hypothetical protein
VLSPCIKRFGKRSREVDKEFQRAGPPSARKTKREIFDSHTVASRRVMRREIQTAKNLAVFTV